MRRFLKVAIVFGSVSLGCAANPGPKAPVVVANDPAGAELRFQDGKRLVKEGKLQEAIEAYEDSERLDHSPSTLYNLADAHEELGRCGTAWEIFLKVADELPVVGKRDLRADANQRASNARESCSTLAITVPPALATTVGLEIRRGEKLLDRALWGKPIPTNPGKHTITVTAPSKQPWRRVTSELLRGQPASFEVPAELEPAPTPWRRTAGLWMGVVGGGLGLAGAIAGIIAVAEKRRAIDECGVTEAKSCLKGSPQHFKSEAQGHMDTALTAAPVSTATLIAGAAVLGAGVVFWFTAPSSAAAPREAALRVSPGLLRDGGGAQLSVDF